MANSVRPAPISPAMPTTSPRRTSKVDVLDHLPLRDAADDAPTSPATSNTGSPIVGVALRKAMGQVAVDHAADDPVLLDRLGPAIDAVDGAAVAQHRDAVGDARRPRSACARSGSRRCPGRGTASRQIEQRRAVVLVQAGGRLVEDQQPHPLGQRLGDLHQLLLADAEIGDQRVRRLASGRPWPAVRCVRL